MEGKGSHMGGGAQPKYLWKETVGGPYYFETMIAWKVPKYGGLREIYFLFWEILFSS